jgi:hypothetical protein
MSLRFSKPLSSFTSKGISILRVRGETGNYEKMLGKSNFSWLSDQYTKTIDGSNDHNASLSNYIQSIAKCENPTLDKKKQISKPINVTQVECNVVEQPWRPKKHISRRNMLFIRQLAKEVFRLQL